MLPLVKVPMAMGAGMENTPVVYRGGRDLLLTAWITIGLTKRFTWKFGLATNLRSVPVGLDH